MKGLEAFPVNGGTLHTTPPSYEAPRGTRSDNKHLVVDWYYVRLECPDGRVIELGYDPETAQEVAKSFNYTKVKARVIVKKVKILREVALESE